MPNAKEMSNVLIDSVLSSLGNLRLFGYEEEKPKPVVKVEVEPYVPPEPITLEKLKELNSEFGIIYTCFPDYRDEAEFSHFPESYYTLRPKEKLLLLFAENFRRQFKEVYQLRRPLVLAVENECRVQKFVTTTIRPTTFVEFPELIDNWQACGSFVADHILYESLEHSIKIPTRLYSPEMVLKSRKGNSFEMATLLCSILIGFGFPAMVVSGYATREVTMNDQRRVKCPYIPEDKVEVEEIEEPDPKYRLKASPFLKSRFLMEVEQKKLDAENEVLAEIELQKRMELEERERPPHDPENGFRTHAWVVMIKNAPWCYKSEFKRTEPQDDDDDNIEPMAFFIEPSTGFRHEVTDPCYQGIESIWNHQNYYVNRQYPEIPIKDMSWDLSETKKWEHFLPGEPYELRKERKVEDEEDIPAEDEVLAIEKHLDMPFSWVEMLHITAVDFEERYLNGEKKEFFKYSIYEKFAPYRNSDGLMRHLTLYETLDYENPHTRYEWYENRDDLLQCIKRDLKTGEVIEEFIKGRNDSIKTFTHYPDAEREVVIEFYATSRFDCLKKIVYNSSSIEEFYEKRRNLLSYRKFFVEDLDEDAVTRSIVKIIEKFDRNEKKPANHDVAIRHFNRSDNKIFVLFHYDDDATTSTSKIFTKPPRSEEDFTFDVDVIEGYVSNPWAPQMTDLELYYLQQDLLKDEEKSVDSFHTRDAEMKEVLEIRKYQKENPLLKFSIFDPLRNESARKLRLQRFEQMKTRELLAKNQQADFLAPYLVRFEDKKPQKEDVDIAIQDCLRDFKKNYADIENELQRRYDESTTELNSLKRFLHRYMDQFSAQDYEKFIFEGENIERFRKIIQQRIVAVREEANRKYGNLVDSIPQRLEQIVEQKKPEVETNEVEGEVVEVEGKVESKEN